MNRRLIKAVSLVLLIALLPVTVLAGCAQKAEGTVYLPIVVPLSGPAAAGYLPAVAQWGAYVRYINEEDPIPGVKLELLQYDTKFNPAEAISAYDWVREQGAKFIAFTDSGTGEALKDYAGEDKFPIITSTATYETTTPPGYVFCGSMDYYRQSKGFMQWLETELTGSEKATVGCFGGNDSFGNGHNDGAKDYAEAHTDKFVWGGSEMIAGASEVLNWGASVTNLLDCDYIICGTFGKGLGSFVYAARAMGWTGKFVLTDANVGFWTAYIAQLPAGYLDNSIWSANGRYYLDLDDQSDFGKILTDEVIANYATDDEKTAFQTMLSAETNLLVAYFATEMLREALKNVDDPDDLTGEMLYEAATTLVLTDLGDDYPSDIGFTATSRVLLPYSRIYEYTDNDWQKVADWIAVE